MESQAERFPAMNPQVFMAIKESSETSRIRRRLRYWQAVAVRSHSREYVRLAHGAIRQLEAELARGSNA